MLVNICIINICRNIKTEKRGDFYLTADIKNYLLVIKIISFKVLTS